VRSGYLLPFEIVSIHLLVVLVGAAYLARAKRRRTQRAIEVAASVRSLVEPVVEVPRQARGSASALATGGTR
jgi:NADH-quinone oxidoreductase subunit J